MLQTKTNYLRWIIAFIILVCLCFVTQQATAQIESNDYFLEAVLYQVGEDYYLELDSLEEIPGSLTLVSNGEEKTVVLAKIEDQYQITIQEDDTANILYSNVTLISSDADHTYALAYDDNTYSFNGDAEALFQYLGNTLQVTREIEESQASGYIYVSWNQENISEDGQSFDMVPYINDDSPIEECSVHVTGSAVSETAVSSDILSSNVVTSTVKNPTGTTVNMFDYWITDQSANDSVYSSSLGDTALTGGINSEHLLQFGTGYTDGTQDVWNKYTGSSNPYSGIVGKTLTNGYPTLNIDSKTSSTLITNNNVTSENAKTESLAYLFNPDISTAGKASYKSLTNLFQVDDSGYYYYDSTQNFASLYSADVTEPTYTVNNGSAFTLYNTGAVSNEGKQLGEFFPFNTGSQVFTTDGSGNLTNNLTSTFSGTLNHYFGLTMETDFRQPNGGVINKRTVGSGDTATTVSDDMIFSFSGDDDVWIYIDGVLVGDLGGIHDSASITINFSTGKIYINAGEITDSTAETTTLRDCYIAALGEEAVNKSNTFIQSNGNYIFQSNTSHALKMFYLERGNWASNLSLSFNLQPLLYQQIKKVDQYGNAMEGVGFTLYEAADYKSSTDYSLGNAVTTKELYTDENGIVQIEVDGEPFSFSDNYYLNNKEYYILVESKPPSGYRSIPENIILHYNPDTSMLEVINQWQTGSYSSFTVTVSSYTTAYKGNWNTSSSEIDSDTTSIISKSNMKDGLIVGVPLLSQSSSASWDGIYGSNTEGFMSVTSKGSDTDSMLKTALEAFLYQAYMSGDTQTYQNVPSWYLSWHSDDQQLEGTLADLPGSANRYKNSNAASSDADMQMVYLYFPKDLLKSILTFESGQSIETIDDETKYQLLSQWIREQSGNTIGEKVTSALQVLSDRSISFVDSDSFLNQIRSLIYVPNEQRSLTVRKIGSDGKRLEGVTFGLFTSKEAAENYTESSANQPIAQGVTDANGELVFSPGVDAQNPSAGEAYISWGKINSTYYLKELDVGSYGEESSNPKYYLNPTVIEVNVGSLGIYPDAGTEDDGVRVLAGVGKLDQTMTKYACDTTVNLTLTKLTAIAQVQNSQKYQSNDWTDAINDIVTLSGEIQRGKEMNLSYKNGDQLIDYGREENQDTTEPLFVTDTGYLRTRVLQNTEAIEAQNSKINYEDLSGIDITNLFCLTEIVEVTDTKDPDDTASLVIEKNVESVNEENYTQSFKFSVEITDSQGNSYASGDSKKDFYFTGSKSGTLEGGKGTVYLSSGESVEILGLKAGDKFTVTEDSTGYDTTMVFKDSNNSKFSTDLQTENDLKTSESNITITDESTNEISTQKLSIMSGSIPSFSTDTKQDDRLVKLDYTNSTPDIRALRIEKSVTGNLGDTSKAFVFELTLKNGTSPLKKNELESDTYKNYLAAWKLNYTKDESSQIFLDNLTYEISDEGVICFTLKDNQAASFILPKGINYEFTEETVSGYQVNLTETEFDGDPVTPDDTNNIITNNHGARGTLTENIIYQVENRAEMAPATGETMIWKIAALGIVLVCLIWIYFRSHRLRSQKSS